MSQQVYVIRANKELSILTKYFLASEHILDKVSVRIYNNSTLAKGVLKSYTKSFDKEYSGSIHCFVNLSDLNEILSKCPNFKITPTLKEQMASKLGITDISKTTRKADILMKKWSLKPNFGDTLGSENAVHTLVSDSQDLTISRSQAIKNIDNLKLFLQGNPPQKVIYIKTLNINKGERKHIYKWTVPIDEE